MPQSLTTRFAPSPTGLLHLGHAFSALLNFDRAAGNGGRFLLRIEDIDRGRCRPEFEDAILRDLRWLGLAWEEPVLRQSERFGIYREAIDKLAARGLLYRCFRTRAELSAIASAPHGPERQVSLGRLPVDEERKLLEEGQPFAWRLDADAARRLVGSDRLPAEIEDDGGSVRKRMIAIGGVDDIVLARKDFPASYHLASVLDDAAQGVSLVWRGEDLADALPVHRLIQELLGLEAPVYRHHRLILGPDGRRLAKRDRAETLEAMRQRGVTPRAIRQQLGLPEVP